MNSKTVNIPEKAPESPVTKRKEYKPRVNTKRYKQGYQAGLNDASFDSSFQFFKGWVCGMVSVIFVCVFFAVVF